MFSDASTHRLRTSDLEHYEHLQKVLGSLVSNKPIDFHNCLEGILLSRPYITVRKINYLIHLLGFSFEKEINCEALARWKLNFIRIKKSLFHSIKY